MVALLAQIHEPVLERRPRIVQELHDGQAVRLDLSRVTTLRAALDPATFTQFTYTYDHASNRTSKTTPEFAESYRYDHLSRLTEVDRTGLPRQWVYGYDAVGNRLSEQVDQAVMKTTHNEKNQLLSQEAGGPLVVQGQVDEAATVTVNGQPARLLPGNVFEGTVTTSPGDNTVQANATDRSGNLRSNVYEVTISGTPTTFTYDHNGNLHQKVEGTTTWDYEWTVENQLERVKKDGAEVATFRYDPLGRRAEEIACGKTYRYLYDGMDILRETITNTTGGTAVATYRYTHGPGIDEPLSRENLTTGAVEYYHADALGSIVKMTSSTGVVVQTRQYDAYGNLEAGGDQAGFAYTGREWDHETGLYYYRARYFDPKIGRFISEDPLFFEGPNLYAYVANDPVDWVDPSGEAPRGKRSIRVTDHRNGGTLTKLSPLAEIKACLKDAIEKAMSPEHIKQLRALKKVVGRGGSMALSSPFILDTTLAEIDRANRCGGLSCLQKQLCDDLAEEGNPDFILSPLGLVPNPCKCSGFNTSACEA